MIVTNVEGVFDIYGGRDTPFGNYVPLGSSRAEILRNHWLKLSRATIELARAELLGKRVACWCTPKQCHLENIAHFLSGQVMRPIQNTVFGIVVSQTLTQDDFVGKAVHVIKDHDTLHFALISVKMPVFWHGSRPEGHRGVLVI